MPPPSFDEICERLEIPEGLKKHVAPTTAERAKMAVARGLLPVPPRTLLAMQYMLLGDASPTVASEAEKSLTEFPEDRLIPLLNRSTHPKLLEFLAYSRSSNQRLIEAIALAHQVNDKTLCYLAETGSSRVCEMVASNHERLILTPQLVLFLQRNERAGKALLDRVRSFQRLYGLTVPSAEEVEVEETAVPEDVGPVVEEAPEPPPETDSEALEPVGEQAESPPSTPPPAPSDVVGPPIPFTVALPENFVSGETFIPPAPTEPYQAPAGLINPIAALLADWGIAADPNFLIPEGPSSSSDLGGRLSIPTPTAPAPASVPAAVAAGGGAHTGHRKTIRPMPDKPTGNQSLASSEFTFDFSEESMDFDSEFVDPVKEDDDEQRMSLLQKLNKLSMAEKIKLAYKGNKSVRELLVRDPNKIIGVAVIKSGRISENEVMTIASNRAIGEDVIRALSENREYLRKYPVKLALVGNPKTPIPTAISLLNSIHVNDLKKLANNRNIGAAVFSMASKLYKTRKQGMK